jgi:hypothetical protein
MKLEMREYTAPDNKADTGKQKAAEKSCRDMCE